MNEFLLLLVAYCLGSIATAVWVGRYYFGIDIRKWGSGNPGAINTFKVLGAKWGTLVLIVDMLKAVVAVKLALLLPGVYVSEDYLLAMQLALGGAAVLGHIFPVWAKFRGGKGVASIFGMAMAIQPGLAVICALVFAVALFLTKWFSLRIITAGIALTLFLVFFFL